MRDPLRREISEVFDRQVGRPPAGIRERVLRGLSEPRRPEVQRGRWLAAVAAVALAALLVAALVLSREAGRQHAVPASSPGPVVTPAARDGAAVVYDDARGQLVMFGGKIPGSAVTDETWTRDGTRWSLASPRTAPPARDNALIAYDPARKQVVLFGGGLGTTLADEELRDTWTWDGHTWTDRSSAAIPPTTYLPAWRGAAMAYDPASRSVLLYLVTGQKVTGAATQTWRWDGARWTQLHPATDPAVFGGTLVSDGRRLLLVGGTRTWTWNGTDWSSRAAATSSPVGSAFAYDETRGRTVALVSSPAGGPWQTWSWDGTAWIVLHPAHGPPRARVSGLYYDSRARRVVAYEPGQPGAQTWTWDGTDWTPTSGP
jgi:hypothetical protein